MHTMKGKAMGRGLDHFRKEGAKLIPPPTADDPYEDEAYRLWTIKQRSKQAKAARQQPPHTSRRPSRNAPKSARADEESTSPCAVLP
jgi:hypothetical protein